MQNIKQIAIITCLLLSSGKSLADAIVIGYTNTLRVPEYSQLLMEQVGQLKFFFAHASVGVNIIQGMTMLSLENPLFYKITPASAGDTPPVKTVVGTIYERDRGNYGYKSKVDTFESYVQNGWNHSEVDLFINKFCFVDPDADFAYYRDSMKALEESNTNGVFVYATIPLMVAEDFDNYRRNVFNDSLREWVVANKRVLYDIADMEAHDTNGTLQTFVYGGRVCQKLFGGYTSDGGHLTTNGAQKMVAKGLYAVAAGVLSRRVQHNMNSNLSLFSLSNGFWLRGDGILGRTYRIEHADDATLTNWQTLGTANVDDFGLFYFFDTNNLTRRAYRSIYP